MAVARPRAGGEGAAPGSFCRCGPTRGRRRDLSVRCVLGTPEAVEVEEVIQGHGVPATADEVERVRGLIAAFARSPLRERAAAGLRSRRELPFAFELEPEPGGGRSLLVNGVVDLHVEEPDGM